MKRNYIKEILEVEKYNKENGNELLNIDEILKDYFKNQEEFVNSDLFSSIDFSESIFDQLNIDEIFPSSDLTEKLLEELSLPEIDFIAPEIEFDLPDLDLNDNSEKNDKNQKDE